MARGWRRWSAAAAAAALLGGSAADAAPLVLMTDFGLKDGAVSEMKGVAYGVSAGLIVSDLTHEIPAGNIFEGAYRLDQTAPYWPRGTVFVGVVDPGVGTTRLSIALRTKAGHVFVLPDNGLVSLIAEHEGVEAVRRINEAQNRLPGSEDSHTFFGRDVYGYVGARLAAVTVRFEDLGPEMRLDQLVRLTYPKAVNQGGRLTGLVPALDVQYGNVWTNIPKSLFDELGFKIGDKVRVRIFQGARLVDEVTAPYARTFGDVAEGAPLLYVNSVLNMALALNLGDYAKAHHIGSGPGWTVEIGRP